MAKEKKYITCFEDLCNNLDECRKTFFLVMRGVSVLRGMPKAISALSKYEDLVGKQDSDKSKNRLDLGEAEDMASYAEMQINNNFPFLYYQTLISVWSFLEAGIYDSLIEWLVFTKFKTISNEMKELKIPFSELSKSCRDRAEILLQIFEQQKIQKKDTISKLEMLMVAVGWEKGGHFYNEYINESGLEENDFRRNLIEFSKVRNLILHKAGIVDKKFQQDCPWKKCKLGTKLIITNDDFNLYQNSVSVYMAEVIHRIMDCEKKFGIKR